MYNISMYKGKTVAILGLSTEGLDSVDFFLKKDVQIICADRRSQDDLGEVYDRLRKLPVTLKLGESYLRDLGDADIIVRTPGMNPRLPELETLRKQRKEFTSLTKLFFNFCKAPIIGVTGTKGKGTTSTLIYEMLKSQGMTAYLGGNVGTPLLSKVDDISKDSVVVLELSSFQLEDLDKSPHVAVVLRVTQEHLANYDTLATNFHLTREAYVKAKKSIILFQSSSDIAIFNADDATSRSFAKDTKAKVYYFSRADQDRDAYVDGHAVYLRWNGEIHKICQAHEILLRGEHNLENIAAASLAAAVCGVSQENIRHVARTFHGLPHRLQVAGVVDGVTYIDDSFSTVPETAIAGIESFPQPIVLILGGSEKGSDFSELGFAVAKNSIKAVVVVGAMSKRIVAALKSGGYANKIIMGFKSMHEIVNAACAETQPGDVVLLSPACASFDMFKNYKDRGEQFTYEVSHL